VQVNIKNLIDDVQCDQTVRGGYCLSNDILVCFLIVMVVTRAIGGKHGRLSKMYASACGQGRALNLSLFVGA
jgi:hypothetical protein